MTNRCGTCTVCCTVVSVGEIDKPGFTRCDYQRDLPAAKIGCAIYDSRPLSCRKWSCMYFSNQDWADELRPDRTGVVFDPIPDLVSVNGEEKAAVQAWVRPGTDIASFGKQPILAVVLAITTTGMPILFRLGPNSAMAVVLKDGELYWTEPTAPNMGAPQADRMRRAARMLPATFHKK